MDCDRRGLLLVAAAAAASAAWPETPRAEIGDVAVRLEAKAAGGGMASRLTYGAAEGLPILHAAKDVPLRVRLRNGLSEPTAIDWHELRSSHAAEVAPGLFAKDVPPGTEATIEIRPTESGTAWFHPPFVPGRSNQTARGLAGVMIVAEPEPPAVDDDVILLLGDRPGPDDGVLADCLSVNRRSWPETRSYAPGSRLRLRLINGSTRKAVIATFTGGHGMVIAIDGQPSELFRPLDDTLPVGPGARFDVLIDLPRTSDERFALTLRGIDDAAKASGAAVFLANLEGPLRPERPAIAPLPANAALPPAIALEKATRADLTVTRPMAHQAEGAVFSVNGATGLSLPTKPLFVARRGSAVSMGVTNKSPELIGVRLHGQAMRPLHPLDDGWEPYWRDSVLVPPGKTFHVAFVPPQPGRWLIESPFFDQATQGLRHWFEIN